MTPDGAIQATPINRPKILFLHVNAQGQFEFLARWMSQNGWDVTIGSTCGEPDRVSDGIRFVSFDVPPTSQRAGDFRYALDYAAVNALGAARQFLRLRDGEGYYPDVVMAHVGWGIGLCVKQIWHATRYVTYHEWYYTDIDWSRDGKVERPSTLGNIVTSRMRNLPIAAEFDTSDANWCPTNFQASRFPPTLRQGLSVIPDGVDCATYRPDPEARIDFEWLRLSPDVPLLTYATRGMEPIRGFPQFLRAVERLQKRRSDFQTLIVASDVVSYGDKLPAGETWLLRMLDSLDLDHRRIHIHGLKPRHEYLRILQASTAHIYFTERFVTSWSLFEALAAGCLVIGSNTAPVEELIGDLETGILVDMDDPEEIAEMVEWSFDHPDDAAAIRARAREQMLKHHDSATIFPRKAEILARLLSQSGRAAVS